MTDSFAPIATELRNARLRKGLSQRALGQRIGMPQSQVSRIETGTVDVRISTLLEIARALDLDLLPVPRPLVPLVDRLIEDAMEPEGSAAEQRPLYELTDDDAD